MYVNKYTNIYLLVIHVESFKLLDVVNLKSLPGFCVMIPSGGDELKQS
jgi:hypothetical protein